MSEPLNMGADASLRRVLEQPELSSRPHRPLRASAHSVRLFASVTDAAQIVLVGVALHPAFPAAVQVFSTTQAVGFGLLAALLATATRCALRPPDRVGLESVSAVTRRAALASFVAVVLMAVTCWITLSQFATPHPYGHIAWFLTWAAASSLGSAGVRYAYARLAERLESGRRILIIGSPEQASLVAHQVKEAPPALWRFAGSIDDRSPGALDTAVNLVATGGADLVVLAISGADAAERVSTVCERLADQPVRISIALDMASFADLPRIVRLPLLDIADDPHGGLGGMAKRGMDILLGALLLLLLAPLLLLAALAIRLDSPGPVFFRQWRFGMGSQPIAVLKFRTMRSEERDASGQRFTRARDPRVTRVGRILRRTSIDELPQLLNVLRGDMSLVGPRPHPLHMRIGGAYYFDVVAHYRARHLIRPGITGWAQINGSRGAVDTLEKARRRVELDLYYLENWSLWLDIRILLVTAFGGFLSLNAD